MKKSFNWLGCGMNLANAVLLSVSLATTTIFVPAACPPS